MDKTDEAAWATAERHAENLLKRLYALVDANDRPTVDEIDRQLSKLFHV